VLEFFTSTHGARKGLADTALRTADSGYLTRRLVDVSQDVIVREKDCFEALGESVKGVSVSDIISEGNRIVSLEDRIRGRYASADVVHPETGEVLVATNEYIDYDKARAIVDAGLKQVQIRSLLTCRSEHGVCTRCYGANMATGDTVSIGEAVGIIAAQSIGEPGTQLTMRTFHTGGVAGADITQGLPRVEELFEARKPKGLAEISEISGEVSIVENKNKRKEITVSNKTEKKSYPIPSHAQIIVHDGDLVEAGDPLTAGSINPHDILKIKGVKGVQDYLLKEVQAVYRQQGVDISDAIPTCSPASWWTSSASSARTSGWWPTTASLPWPCACCWASPRRRWPPSPSCRRPRSRKRRACLPRRPSRERWIIWSA